MSTSPSGNPLGPFVSPPPVGISKQISTTLPGRLVTLVPGHGSHVEELFEVLGGVENAVIWDYIPFGPFMKSEDLENGFTAHWQNPDEAFFTIINNATKKAVGSLALIRIDRENRCLEVGYVLFSKQLQRTVEATEVMYLLACHVFDKLGYRRYEWKCDNLNGPSKRAALRLGFQFEGVFRQHMIVKGRNRDTAWFAIMDGEWPTVKKGFEGWLDADNFDQEGKQLKSLAAVRGSV
ncbi:unnamed protein product [Calypogeia fissa]